MAKLFPALLLGLFLLTACENQPEEIVEPPQPEVPAPPTPTNFEEQAKYHLHFLKQSDGYDFLLPQVAPIYQFSFLSGHFHGGYNHPFVYWDPVLKTFMVSWYVTLVNFPEEEKTQMRETFETLLSKSPYGKAIETYSQGYVWYNKQRIAYDSFVQDKPHPRDMRHYKMDKTVIEYMKTHFNGPAGFAHLSGIEDTGFDYPLLYVVSTKTKGPVINLLGKNLADQIPLAKRDSAFQIFYTYIEQRNKE